MDILDAISSIFVQQDRPIGSIMPDVLLEKIHRDRCDSEMVNHYRRGVHSYRYI